MFAVLCIYFFFLSFWIEIPVCKLCRPWSDAALCGYTVCLGPIDATVGTKGCSVRPTGWPALSSLSEVITMLDRIYIDLWVCDAKPHSFFLVPCRLSKNMGVAQILTMGSNALYFIVFAFVHLYTIWAATRQNQQSDCAPSEDSDQPGHPPSLTRVFAVRMKKAWVFSYSLSSQRRLWSEWADAQADLSLRPGWSESSLGARSLCWFCHVAAHLIVNGNA